MVLFDVNDVFSLFTQAFTTKFGVAPEDLSKADLDAKLATLIRTDFYSTLPRRQAGMDMLKWCRTYDDRNVVFILIAEAKSPTWVDSEKINYVDAICTTLGLPRMDFSRVKTLDELKAHAYRGVFLSCNNEHRRAWDAGNKYPSVYLEDDLELTKYMIEKSNLAGHNAP